jgi:hypothetical protein
MADLQKSKVYVSLSKYKTQFAALQNMKVLMQEMKDWKKQMWL